MALLGYDGFDHQRIADDLITRVGTVSYGTRTVNIGNSTLIPPFITGRTGIGRALALGGGLEWSRLSAVVPSARSTLISGVGLISDNIDKGNSAAIIAFYDSTGGAIQCYAKFDGSNGRVTAYRKASLGPDNIIGFTDNNSYSSSAWQFCEAKATIHSTAGAIEAKVQGQTVLSLTNVNTQLTANASADVVEINPIACGGDLFPGSVAVDDFYICDTAVGPGSFPCNDFLGDLTVVTLNPTANNSVQWNPVDISKTNWQEVGGVIFNGDVDYNWSITPGDEDRFVFAPLLNTLSGVIAVQITGAYRKDDATTHTLNQRMVSGGTTVSGTTLSLSTSFQYIADLFVQDPNGNIDWTATNVNLLLAGYRLAS